MTLTRAQIVDAGYVLLREQGLAGMTMRRVAQDLGVQPGALYYHVANKQELLAEVAARILAGVPAPTDPRQAARDLREALLPVRDGAEVVSFVRAFRPESLGAERALPLLFAQLPADRARWAADALVHYVLGFVAEEQNRAELVRLGIIGAEPGRDAAEAFGFGVDAIVVGLTAG